MTLPMTELRAFVTLAEQLHFGRTADRLHITQPALTKQIQRLEEAVGGALVRRGYREVRLTAAGEVLLPHAARLLEESAAALDIARRAVRGQLGVLRLGFGLATVQLLPDLLLRFRSAFPGVELRLRDMPTPAQVGALVSGDLDVGFVRLPISVVQETNELFTMMMLVQGGLGIALAPSSVTIRRPAGVRVKTVKEAEAAWDIGIAWSRARHDAPLVRAFVETALRVRRGGGSVKL
jgi:DNA-binding transcriptional LysR family regulator